MRKSLSLFIIGLLALLLAACGGSATPTPTQEPAPATEESAVATEPVTPTEETTGTEEVTAGQLGTGTTWTCPEGFEGQTLSIYNWATYIGDSTVDDFKKLCGVEVKYDVYDSDESAIARLQQGNPGYDVSFPTDYAVSIMRRQGLLEEIDFSKVPNFANIDKSYTNKPFDPDNKHSVPYLLGTTGIAYRKSAFPNGISTWKELFDFNGRIAWLDSSRAMLGAALIELGYDPNSVDTAQLDEARDYLIAHSKNVITIASDDGDAILVQGEVDAAVEYGGDMYQQIQECGCDDFGFASPLDGVILDITSVVLLKDGPNKELAEVFIDFLADPHVAAHNTNQLGYSTPNAKA
ncbi:MAG TPA: spermidine/putrescine ABC transporter substrate-binding protein, partial [Phototrophicaceae bacterium]|nr:spermidine/putrescine ABC transporter substrate-binding protein [Phototrophicaceae bacterium]